MAFIDARQNAGRPVILVRPSPRSVAASTSSSASTQDDDPLPESIGRETCPICIVDFEDGDDLRVLPCEGKHVFHQTCVDPWLLELSSSCPICRHGTSHLVFVTHVWILMRVVFGSCRLPSAGDDAWWWRAHRAARVATSSLLTVLALCTAPPPTQDGGSGSDAGPTTSSDFRPRPRVENRSFSPSRVPLSLSPPPVQILCFCFFMLTSSVSPRCVCTVCGLYGTFCQ
jgi:Ring finger domain